MLAVDWSVKQRYWATQANYHLFYFPFCFCTPSRNMGELAFGLFFFLWIAFNYIVAIDQSGGIITKVFNAFSFFMGCYFFRKQSSFSLVMDSSID